MGSFILRQIFTEYSDKVRDKNERDSVSKILISGMKLWVRNKYRMLKNMLLSVLISIFLAWLSKFCRFSVQTGLYLVKTLSQHESVYCISFFGDQASAPQNFHLPPSVHHEINLSYSSQKQSRCWPFIAKIIIEVFTREKSPVIKFSGADRNLVRKIDWW